MMGFQLEVTKQEWLIDDLGIVNTSSPSLNYSTNDFSLVSLPSRPLIFTLVNVKQKSDDRSEESFLDREEVSEALGSILEFSSIVSKKTPAQDILLNFFCNFEVLSPPSVRENWENINTIHMTTAAHGYEAGSEEVGKRSLRIDIRIFIQEENREEQLYLAAMRHPSSAISRSSTQKSLPYQNKQLTSHSYL